MAEPLNTEMVESIGRHLGILPPGHDLFNGDYAEHIVHELLHSVELGLDLTASWTPDTLSDKISDQIGHRFRHAHGAETCLPTCTWCNHEALVLAAEHSVLVALGFNDVFAHSELRRAGGTPSWACCPRCHRTKESLSNWTTNPCGERHKTTLVLEHYVAETLCAGTGEVARV